MDGIGSSMASTNWSLSAQSVLPSQPSQPIVIPPTAANSQSNQSSDQSQSNTSQSPVLPATKRQNEEPSSPQASEPVQAEREARQQEQQVEQVLAQLRARDQEVRTHEQAHLAAAGPYARGGIKYDYQTGPDGQKYAVGGSVGIDTSPISGDPEATIQKMMVVQRAALAPAQPSGQDMKVAAQASQLMSQARVELQVERMEEFSKGLESEPEVVADGATAESSTSIGLSSSEKVFGLENRARNDFDLRISLQGQADYQVSA